MSDQPLSDDEKRLVRFYRCLDSDGQREVLTDAGQRAMKRCLPDRSVSEFMPISGGVEPEPSRPNTDETIDNAPMRLILRAGIEETGDASETLLGPGDDADWEAELVERFAHGATREAENVGCWSFNFDREFAREYLRDWRWEIVRACERVLRDRKQSDSQ